MKYQYQFIKVDRDSPDLSDSVANYKKLRLEALRQSPAAFSSTLALESQFPDELWVSRLRNPEKETFACVATSEDGQSEWVGQVSLRGPLPATEFVPPPGSGQADVVPVEEEEKWQLLSLYTLPTHRGRRLAARLCESTFDFLKSRQGGGAPRVVLRTIVKVDNTASLRLFDGLGFGRAGLSTQEEALRANGDAELIPEGPLDERYTTRNGVVLLLHLKRQG